MRHRVESARIGAAHGSKAPSMLMLTQLAALMGFVRTEPNDGLDDRKLVEMQTVTNRFPSAGNQFRLALAYAHNGSPDQAVRVMQELCAVQRIAACHGALNAWNTRMRTDGKLPLVVLRQVADD